MKESILDLQYLWDGTCPQLGLFGDGDEEAGLCQIADKFSIVDFEKKMILIIEDADLARQVVEKMLSAGVKILSSSEYAKLFQKPTK
jgi:hypothetical protein